MPEEKPPSLLRATWVVSAMTLLSRVLGLLRDMVFARFGVGAGMDAFFVAFKIPNFMRRLFAEGAFSQAFVPVISEYRSQRDGAEVRLLVDQVAGTLAGVLALITLLGVIGAPLLVMAFAPGFLDDDGKFTLTVDMLRFTFPYMLFISLTAFAGGVLNTYSRFAVPAATPVLMNLVLIGMALFAAPYFAQPVMALAVGVFAAGLVQLAFQLPFLAQLGLLPRPRWAWSAAPVQRIMKLMLPALLGSSVAQINLLFDTLIASFLVTGSVSWLYYADRLLEFPLGVFAIALSTVILPHLSRQHARADAATFSATLDWALRMGVLIAVPAAVGLFVLSGPLLATLFQYGAFSARDVAMAQWALMAYALGLGAFTLVKILVPGYFARQDTKTPARIAIIALIVNMVLNVLFVVPLVMSDFVAPHAGLALATGGSAVLNAALLYRGLRAGGFYTPRAGWRLLWLRVLLAAVVMGAVVHWLAGDLALWLAMDAGDRAGRLGLAVLAGAGSYAGCLMAAGLRPAMLKAPG